MGGNDVKILWIPYSIGCIWSYANQNPVVKEFVDLKKIFYTRLPVQEVIDQLDDPDVCVFSSYVWNLEYNLQISKAIKTKWPQCQILFGGPAVDENLLDFFAKYPWVDSIINGEGEVAFSNFLVDAVSSHTKKSYRGDRIKDLELPSPYLSGVFDQFMAETPNTRWNAIIETNRGCPFSCTFCDWGSTTQSKIHKFPLQKTLDEIDWCGRNKIEAIYIADANFGVFHDRDMIIAQHLIATKKKYGYPIVMDTNYYKNSTDKVLEIIQVLESGGLVQSLTLAVQSNTPEVLKAIKRQNMEISNLGEIYKKCDERNLAYYTEFILPLPEETETSWRNSLCQALEYGCNGAISVYPTELLVNSELAQSREQYQLDIKPIRTARGTCESNILEKSYTVTSTSTMSRSELVNSWKYAWLITMFHSHGWVQHIANFVRHYHNKSYNEIYDSLLDYVLTVDMFKSELDKVANGMQKFFDHSGADFMDPVYNIVSSQCNQILPRNRETVLTLLEPWYQQQLSQVDSDLATEIINYQRCLPVSINNVHGYNKEFKFDLIEYLKDGQLDSLNNAVRYHIAPRGTWNSESEYYLFFRIRYHHGFARHKFTKL